MPAAAMGVTNVRDYGARGNAKNDDAAAIQTAIDQGGGTIHFPPGTYRITKGLIARLSRRGKIQIRGSGARLFNESRQPAIRIVGSHKGTADPDSVTDVTWEKESSPLVSDIEILGNRASGDGIRIEGIMQPIVSRVTVRDCRHGIHLTGLNRNVLIADCHVYNNTGVGIFLDDLSLHQINITGSHISYNRRGGVKALRGNVRNIQIAGNDIEYNFDPDDRARVTADVWLAAGPVGIREGAICGNTIQACPTKGGANVRIESIDRDTNLKAGHFAITGNLISSQETNILLQRCRGIVVQGNTLFNGHLRSFHLRHCAHVVLDSNVIDCNPDYGLEAAGPIVLDHCRDCTVSGISTESMGGPASKGASIAVRDSEAIDISRCRLIDPPATGILLRNVRDSRIAGCTILERRAERTMEAAIAVAGKGSRGNMVVGNRLQRGSRGDLDGLWHDCLADGNHTTD